MVPDCWGDKGGGTGMETKMPVCTVQTFVVKLSI